MLFVLLVACSVPEQQIVLTPFVIAPDSRPLAYLGARMILKSGMHPEYERAAFIMKQPDGTLSLMHWPFDHLRDQAQWRAQLPSHAIAIMHTHPTAQPRPSYNDMMVAARTGLPVIAVTRQSVCIAMPMEAEAQCSSYRIADALHYQAAGPDPTSDKTARVGPDPFPSDMQR